MKIFKISTIALAMALTGWVACGNSGGGNAGGTGGNTIPSTGGTVPVDSSAGGAGGSGGAGGTTGAIDAGPDVSIGPDTSDTSIAEVTGTPEVTPPPAIDGGPVLTICTGLTAAECHLAIINAATDPGVSALDPGANPPILYPACAAQ